MELQYFGGNCVTISTKKTTLVVDDNLADLGLKAITKDDNIALFTQKHEDPTAKVKLVVDTPGEYEVSGVSISGVGVRAYKDETDQKSAVVYKIVAGDIRIAIAGHIFPDLTENQLEAIGMVDVLILPVGGNGLTLNGLEALKVIRKIEPKIIIPTHYSDKQVKYAEQQQSLEEAVKDIALEVNQTLPRLKIKPAEITENTQLIVLERQ